MNLSFNYSLIAAKPIPYVTREDVDRIYHHLDPAQKEFRFADLPKTLTYKQDQYSYTGKYKRGGKHSLMLFHYESGPKYIWVDSQKRVYT